jgi:periplasmic divalent cation tolerance protein
MSQYSIVLTAVDSYDLAHQISQALVENKLAACVQVIGPISSTYSWKGSIQTESEWLCLIKTRQDLLEDVEKAVSEMHSYEVPEVIAIDIVDGSEKYLAWMTGVLSQSRGDRG